MARELTFRAAVAPRKGPNPPLPSDRSATWKYIKELGPSTADQRTPPSALELLALTAFGKLSDSLLEVPENSLPPPFTYYTTVNDADPSMLSELRLSVTKLLTDSWCELQTFYSIYAGLPKRDTSRMRSGTEYHQHLEDQNHAKVSADSLDAVIAEELAQFSDDEKTILRQNALAAKLGTQWTEQIVVRSLAVAKEKFAREILVHGFLNLYTGKLVTSADEFPSAVLVNGVADIVKIDNLECHKDFTRAFPKKHEEQSQFVEDISDRLGALKLGETPVADLSQELVQAKQTLDDLSKTHYLHVRDVKTRASNSVPPQQLAVDSAKIQCLYYAQFLDNLSTSVEFAYYSNLENARRRGVYPDTPIGAARAVGVLIANFPALVLDMKRLATGSPLGFEDFDVHSIGPGSEEVSLEYSLGSFVSEQRFREILSQFYGEDSHLLKEDISVLFGPWKKPLTLRYFAARTAQAFNVFHSFKPSSVCIEYHNVRTHQIIACKHFPFDSKQVDESLQRASQFWTGQRPPEETADRNKCKSCDFRSRCSAINHNAKELAGDMIYKLLE